MLRLILTPEQTKMLATAAGTVEIVNSFGHTIGEFTLNDPSATETHVLSPEVLAEMRRIDKESKAVPAIKAALADMESGDEGRSAREILNESRRKHNN